MRKMKSPITAAILALAVGAGGYAFLGSPLTPTVQARLHDHPRLEEADQALKEAYRYLEEADNDFHGHKIGAMKCIHLAREKIWLCAEEPNFRSNADSPASVKLVREHEKLWRAKEHLEHAKEYLEHASHDFHGHRQEAVDAVQAAIYQLNHILEAR